MSVISKIVIQFNLHLRAKRLLGISAIASEPMFVLLNIHQNRFSARRILHSSNSSGRHRFCFTSADPNFSSTEKLGKNQRAILATEAKAVRKSSANRCLPGFIRHVIEITIGIWCFVVNGRR